MNTFFAIIIFLLGTAVGSFLSTIVHRLKNGKKGIFIGRSMCPHCETQLNAMDLIPLASFLLLKRRCRYCEKNIPSYYFFIELLSGTIFLLLFLKFNFLTFGLNGIDINMAMLSNFLFSVILGSLLVAIFFFDLLYFEIPDHFSIPFAVLALLQSLAQNTPTIRSMLAAIIITLIFFGGQIVLSKGKWLGQGDLRLGIGMAILFGWKLFLVALFISYTIGAITSIILMITKKFTMKSQIAFGPFLVLGTLITMLFGQIMLETYQKLIGL